MDPIVEITGVAHGGTCVGRLLSGKVVFVRHTAPGETVRVQITEELATRAFGDAIDVVVASPHRRAHIWPEAARHNIGGVELGHLSPLGQREFKEAVLDHTLRRIGGADIAEAANDVREPIRAASPGSRGTRTRFRTILNDEGRPAMRRYHSNDLVAIDRMPLAVAPIADLSEVTGPAGAQLRHVATSTGEVHVVEAGADVRITEQVSVAGSTYSYQLSTDRFWQAHEAAPQLLAEQVRSGLFGPGDPEGISVLELFSGVGLFSAPIHDVIGRRGRLITVEGSEAAAGDARANVHSSVEVRHGRIDRRSVRALLAEHSFDAIVVDPPRTGLGKDVASLLADSGAVAVILIACDPAAFARDLAVFVRKGYDVQWIVPFDLFEHTHHLETTALLTLP